MQYYVLQYVIICCDTTVRSSLPHAAHLPCHPSLSLNAELVPSAFILKKS